MKRLLLLATAAAAVSLSIAAPAAAQSWQSINQRQAILDQRIDQGVRSGTLTQQEAILLRGEFRTLANLEAEYRRSGSGLSSNEIADLDRRFDALSARILTERGDRQNLPGTWLNQRQAILDQRIDQGVRSGGLTQQEAILLRGEFRTLANLEAEYRRSGGVLSSSELADLDRRFDALSARILTERRDWQNRPGWQSINQRQAILDQRIDQGVRSGAISQREAILLRGEFRTLANLEAEYRRSGGRLSDGELADLDRRFDALSARVRIERQNWQYRPGGAWQSINQRQAMLDQRIDQGVRSGALTQQEAILLRGEFRTLANLEAEYRRSGGVLSSGELADLDRRFDALSARVRIDMYDRQERR
ncbi:MAG TPA: hypothetical protein VGW34_12285 [Allosphingosinicella sp.]|nr:hypothetical protein [Allosphingosinicella sp.]